MRRIRSYATEARRQLATAIEQGRIDEDAHAGWIALVVAAANMVDKRPEDPRALAELRLALSQFPATAEPIRPSTSTDVQPADIIRLATTAE